MSNATAIPVEDPAVVTVENSVPAAIQVGPDTPLRAYWSARRIWLAAVDAIPTQRRRTIRIRRRRIKKSPLSGRQPCE